MQINKISALVSYPVFTAQKSNIPSGRPDTFERRETVCKPFNLNREIDRTYKNIKKSAGIISPAKVEHSAANVLDRLGDYTSPKEVFQAMEILTQYSNFNSISNLQYWLRDKNIKVIANLPQIFKDERIDKIPLSLTNVLHYFSLKNFGFSNDSSISSIVHLFPKAVIMDSNLADTLGRLNENYRKSIFDKKIEDELLVPVYLKNFENGYNFLRQDLNLEDLAVDVIKRAKTTPYDGTFKERVEYVLNAENLKRFEKLGIKPEIIEYVPEFKSIFYPAPVRIANNLNPKIICEKDLKNFIKEISPDDVEYKEVYQKYYIDFLNEMFSVITPKKYADLLKDMHENLLLYLQKQNKSLDNTYFVIPSPIKSFVAANYQYQFINEKAHDRFIYYKGSKDFIKSGGKLDKLPDNSTVVVLDDCVATGMSMLYEVFNYSALCESKILRDKNIGVVIAPVVITQAGLRNIKEVTEKNGREKIDKIIPGKILPAWPDKRHEFLEKLYKYFVPNETDRMTAVVFPYMGPDTNCFRFIPLYQKFLYAPQAQKETLDEFCI